jgi:hypothetical protein
MNVNNSIEEPHSAVHCFAAHTVPTKTVDAPLGLIFRRE